MEIIYSDEALQDIAFWRKSGNKIIQKKIQQLIAAIEESPFEGIGKPEALKHNLSGLWSRRGDQEHRIIYELIDGASTLKIISLKGHYEK